MEDYRSLEEFRYQIRRFLHFSEGAARGEGLEPQQHQLLLTMQSKDEPPGPTIGWIADRMMIRHHSAVGLVDRLAERGLVERIRGDGDRRQVRVRLTPSGQAKLKRLAGEHREELREAGPRLVGALERILREGNVSETAGGDP